VQYNGYHQEAELEDGDCESCKLWPLALLEMYC
jgi:hypothetical protein